MKKLAKLIADLETAGVAPEAILNVIKLHLGAPAKPKLVTKRRRRTKAELAAARAQENAA